MPKLLQENDKQLTTELSAETNQDWGGTVSKEILTL